ncbi:MAG: bifunctional oligoribonuclease/PAP phosphatase NrnA [Candidatus Peregrinibacteria bacterium]
MKLDEKAVQDIGALITRANRILIIPHKLPDGDTLGAALALYQTFKEMGKAPEVVCLDPPAEVFAFMPNIEIVQVGEPRLEHEAYFILDAGATHLTGFNETHPQLFDKSLPVVNIDHHPTNEFYGKYNIVIPKAASTTAILFELLSALKIPIGRQTATCLLTGLYTDTGSFQHSNTTSEVLRIAGKLLARGANVRTIAKDIFNTTKISTMRLWGRVLKNIDQTDENVTISVITEKDFKDCQANYDEVTGVVDYVNSVPGAPYSVILTERDGKVKGSMRTLQEDMDVAAIAANYGGGGHTKAAGFTVPGHLEREVRWKVVETTEIE